MLLRRLEGYFRGSDMLSKQRAVGEKTALKTYCSSQEDGGTVI